MPKNSRIIYSTDPDIKDDPVEREPTPASQDLRIWLTRLGGGKLLTVVRGFKGSESDLKEMGKLLKTTCSTGGTVKNGEILIQGNHREKVLDILKKNGHHAKLSGG